MECLIPLFHHSVPAFSRSVRRTSSATECTFIFSITRARWTLMVFSTVPRSSAISLFSCPETTWSKTSRSRGVSVASRPGSHQFGAGLPRDADPSRGPREGSDQLVIIHGLDEEIECAALHRLHAHGYVAVAGKENNRDRTVLRRQNAFWSSRPVKPGIAMSSTRQPGAPGSCRSRNSWGELKVSHDQLNQRSKRERLLSTAGSSSTIKTVGTGFIGYIRHSRAE